MLRDKTILITKGAGPFGHNKIKQWEVDKLLQGDEWVQFFIGDLSGRDRLYCALDGMGCVVISDNCLSCQPSRCPSPQ